MGTKILARLYVGVCEADKIGQMGGSHLLVVYVLAIYIIPDLVFTGFTNFRISFDILFESTGFLKMMSTRFS